MSGLKGMSRLPRDTVRARRNATKFASDFVSMLGDGLTVTAGLVVIDLAADPGLDFSGGDLIAKVAAPIALDATGIHLDYTTGLTLVGSDLVVDDTVFVPYAGATAALDMGAHAVTAEQLTSTDDITMQGHLLTLGDGTAADVVLSFDGSAHDGAMTWDESAGRWELDSGIYISSTNDPDGLLLNIAGQVTGSEANNQYAAQLLYTISAAGGGARVISGLSTQVKFLGTTANQTGSMFGMQNSVYIAGNKHGGFPIASYNWIGLNNNVGTGIAKVVDARIFIYNTKTGTFASARNYYARGDAEDGTITNWVYFYGEAPAKDGGSVGTFAYAWFSDVAAAFATATYGIVIDSDNVGLTLGASQGVTLLGSGGDLLVYTAAQKTLELQTLVWDDINVGAITLVGPPGLQPGPDEFVDSDGVGTGIFSYAVAVDGALSGSFELRHNYAEGTDLVFHIHWQAAAAPTGTDHVQWRLDYTIARDTVVVAPITPITIETDVDTQYEMLRSDFAAISGAALKIGDQFLFTLTRIDASADEYGGAAILATLGIHHQVDTMGSRQIVLK